MESVETSEKTKPPQIFGFKLNDPQDYISLGLYAIIIYNSFDLIQLLFSKATEFFNK